MEEAWSEDFSLYEIMIIRLDRFLDLIFIHQTMQSVGRDVVGDFQEIEDGWKVMSSFLDSIRNISAEINPEDAANKVPS